MVLSLLKSLLDQCDVLGSFPLPCWSRSKWWPAFSHHALQLLNRAHTVADITTGICSNFSLRLYKVITSYCGPFVE